LVVRLALKKTRKGSINNTDLAISTLLILRTSAHDKLETPILKKERGSKELINPIIGTFGKKNNLKTQKSKNIKIIIISVTINVAIVEPRQ